MTNQPSTLTIVGLGKLGAPMVACLASKGFDVIAVAPASGQNRIQWITNAIELN